jgi:hypothetical protein
MLQNAGWKTADEGVCYGMLGQNVVCVCTCHYHAFFCMLQYPEFLSNVICKFGIFNTGLNRPFQDISLVLLMVP